MSANLPTRPEVPFLRFGHKWCCKLLAFQVSPPQLPDLQGVEGRCYDVLPVFWFAGAQKCYGMFWACCIRTNYGHIVETCWCEKFASTVKFLAGALSWNHLDFESSKNYIYVDSHLLNVWFKRRTYDVKNLSIWLYMKEVLAQKPGSAGSKRSIMMNPWSCPFANRKVTTTFILIKRKVDQERLGDHLELWSHKKIKHDPRILGKACVRLPVLKRHFNIN